MHHYPRLAADIGGTHARFALCEAPDGPLLAQQTLRTADFPSLGDAIAHYLASAPLQPRGACLAVAAPVRGDNVEMTNHPWRFHIGELRRQLQLDRLVVINDFEAVALAVPALAPDQLLSLGGGAPAPDQPLAVLGPGTGFGAALLIPRGDGWRAIASQAGHAALAPGNTEERALFDYWRRQGLPLSRESFLSGPGLLRIYRGLAALRDRPPAINSAEQLQQAINAGETLALDTQQLFLALLGSASGDQALACGARGGVYLAGGILPRYREHLAASPFRQRFEDKPPMEDYLRDIPTALITAEQPGLLGAARQAL